VDNVLSSDRTGLICTGILEGAQPGGLTSPGQTEQGIPYHLLSCWVLVERSWAVGTHSRLGSVWRQSGREWLCSAGSVLWFVLCVPLFCIVVVPVPSVCCSVKLPLSRPTGFCLFLSILLRTPAGGRMAAWRFCCQPQPNHNTLKIAFSLNNTLNKTNISTFLFLTLFDIQYLSNSRCTFFRI